MFLGISCILKKLGGTGKNTVSSKFLCIYNVGSARSTTNVLQNADRYGNRSRSPPEPEMEGLQYSLYK